MPLKSSKKYTFMYQTILIYVRNMLLSFMKHAKIRYFRQNMLFSTKYANTQQKFLISSYF